MKVKDVVAGTVLAVGLGVGSLVGAGVASAAPGAPSIDIAQKPHHGDWDDWGPGAACTRGSMHASSPPARGDTSRAACASNPLPASRRTCVGGGTPWMSRCT